MLCDQRFGLAAQDLGFQPVMQVKPEFFFSMRRHSIRELIEPLLGLAEPAARLLGLPKAVIGQGQPEPVDDGAARLGISLETLFGETCRGLELSRPVCQGALLGQRPELRRVLLEFVVGESSEQLSITCAVGGEGAGPCDVVGPWSTRFVAPLDQWVHAAVA